MEGIQARSYQLEMLDQSLKQNIILVMDTGSGKTYVASMRIMAELQRCDESQIVWFLTPTVALAMQQKEAIGSHLPAINIRLLTGNDGVERWSDQRTWDAALRGMKIIISTHAVLADALTHRFVQMEKLALLVFDEAHHCVKNHPGNRIMRDFYHPTRIAHGSHRVPHILGLTASPIMRSNVADISKIETNLNAISKTPQLQRQDLMKYVFLPSLRLLYYSEIDAIRESQCIPSLQALRRLVSNPDFAGGADPKLIEMLSGLYRKAVKIVNILGAWAADHFLMETIQRVVGRTAMDDYDLWADQDIMQVTAQMQAILMTDRTRICMDGVISKKAERLLVFLAEEHHQGFSGIVFVQERAVAYALSALVAHHPLTRALFRCEPCVGSTHRSKKQEIWELLDTRDVDGTLRRFRERRCNLIVATNVLEEGIDLSACRLVACFDPPSNVKSFIQRRGRARQEHSTFAILVSNIESLTAVKTWQNLENEMIQMYQNHERMLLEIQTLEATPEDIPFQFRLPTGALLTAHNAMSHLYHFCNTLPSEPQDQLHPRFKIERRHGMVHATALMPCVIEPSLRIAKGAQCWLTENSAKRDAAFQAYVLLYRAGLVNDNLLPLHQSVPGPKGTTEGDLLPLPKKIHIPNVYNPWTPTSMLPYPTEVHKYRVSVQQNGIDRPELSIILTCFVRVPLAKPLQLFWDSKTKFMTSFQELGVSTISETQLAVMRDITQLYLSSASTTHRKCEAEAGYAVMASPDIPTCTLSIWLSANQGSRSCHDQYLDDPEIAPRGFIRSESLYNRPYRFIRWRGSNERSQVLVECQPFPKRRNMLREATLAQDAPRMSELSLDCERESVSMEIPADSCTCDMLPWEISRSSLILAPVTQHLRRLLVAARLQEDILPSYPTIELETLADAITAPSAQWTSNYQRLEFLGDGVLKFVTCVQLFHEYPLWPEGYLSQRKSHIVSNNYLTRAALRVGLQRFVLIEPLASRRWKMPTVSETLEGPSFQHEMSSKVLADVLEAVLGTAFVHGGIPTACSIIHDLLRCVPSTMPSLVYRKPLEEDLVIGPHSEKELEQLIGYKFNNPLLMWEALTHPSWQRDVSTNSYQRLEFLGDAVLDMVVTEVLFKARPSLAEGDMSQIKAALVNRHFLAFLCMQSAIETDFVEIQESQTGSFDQVVHKRLLNLWAFMRHDNPDIAVSQQSCLKRHHRLRGHIQQQLNSGNSYPWAALTQLGANKFYSDIVESLVGAIFIDSSGSNERCYEFLHHIRLAAYLERILHERLDVEHPRATLGRVSGSKRIKFNISPSSHPTTSYNVAVSVKDTQVAWVTGCLSKDECIVRGADLAIQNLHLEDSTESSTGNTT